MDRWVGGQGGQEGTIKDGLGRSKTQSFVARRRAGGQAGEAGREADDQRRSTTV